MMTITTTAFHFKSRNTDSKEESGDQVQQKSFELLLRTRISQYSSEKDLSNPNSPQSQALEWILSREYSGRMHAQFEDLDDAAFKELYSLAVLYYSTNGENWAIKEGYSMASHRHCYWNKDLIGCNTDTNILDGYGKDDDGRDSNAKNSYAIEGYAKDGVPRDGTSKAIVVTRIHLGKHDGLPLLNYIPKAKLTFSI